MVDIVGRVKFDLSDGVGFLTSIGVTKVMDSINAAFNIVLKAFSYQDPAGSL